MSEEFAFGVLKVSLAQICQNIGWHAIETTPMNSLIEIMHRYLLNMCKVTHQYAEHYNRTEPNLDDLELAFKDFGLSLAELEEYANNVKPVPFARPVPKFPVANTDKFHFPKEGSKEVTNRPEWFLPHLPVAYPELEGEDESCSPSATSDGKVFFDGSVSGMADASSPVGSPRSGVRRPLELTPETNFSTSKRPRLHSDEEGRPMRGVMSVTMTAAGFISSAREGRLPDTCTPFKGFEDSCPNSPVPAEKTTPVPSPTPLPAPEEPDTPKKEEMAVKKSDGMRFKKLSKDNFVKKIRVKKENKENRKKLKKMDGLPKSKIHGKADKIKKERLDKSPRCSLDSKEGWSPKSMKLSKIPKLTKAARMPKVPKIPLLPKIQRLSMVPGAPKIPQIPKLPKFMKPGKFAKPKLPKIKLPNVGNSSKSSDGSPTPEGGFKSPSSASSMPTMLPGAKSPKEPKSPKGTKPKVRVPKPERPVPGGQLASLLTKAGAASMTSDKTSFGGSDRMVAGLQEQWEPPSVNMKRPAMPSICDLPPRLIIDDDDTLSRMASIEDCISAVIQRGMKDEAVCGSVGSSSGDTYGGGGGNAHNEVEYLPMAPATVKLDPRDVYDFTDDEDTPGLSSKLHRPAPPPPSPLPPFAPAPFLHHRVKEGSQKCTKESKKNKKKHGQGGSGSDRDHKSKKLKSAKAGKRRKSDSSSSEHLAEDFRPKTPKADDSNSGPPAMSRSDLAFHGPSMGLPPYSSLSHIPPALLPFPIAYLMSLAGGGGRMSPGCSRVPYPELAEVALTKAFSEGGFDVGKVSKDKKRDKSKQQKEKQDKKEHSDKLKTKKKDKVKEKGGGSGGLSEKERGDKSKGSRKRDKSIKSKEKKEKSEKKRDKGKNKDKQQGDKKSENKTLKRDKPKKVREDAESGTASQSVVPRLTFKLGSTGAIAEGTKIVIKAMANPNSPLPPVHVVKELLPPPPPPPPPPQPAPQPQPSASQPPPSSLHPVLAAAPGKSHTKGSAAKGQGSASSSTHTRSVVTETIGRIIDESGNKIWICPACKHPDDGSPMIGCDECDEWYHWVCVGIVVPPKEEENWFCTRCIAKKQSSAMRRKHRKEK